VVRKNAAYYFAACEARILETSITDEDKVQILVITFEKNCEVFGLKAFSQYCIGIIPTVTSSPKSLSTLELTKRSQSFNGEHYHRSRFSKQHDRCPWGPFKNPDRRTTLQRTSGSAVVEQHDAPCETR
jgi:hypothetical protein